MSPRRALLALLPLALLADPARADAPRGRPSEQAEVAISKLEMERAANILEGAAPTDPDAALARGLLALSRGDCDGAVAILSRPDLQKADEAAHYGDVARGCARTMAAAVLVTDERSGVWARFQDDRDTPLFPWVVRTVEAMRPVFERDLGVTMPKRIFVEVVHDQLGLSAMTGLPEDAARTTGTVAVAKWGRVIMLSPRAAMESGYRWQDTLAHELTHLAIMRGSADRAPLWLHEGIAKREETLWRPPDPTDEVPGVDALAAVGMSKGFGRPIDALGPSLALLPTPEDARVAYAEVTSFMRFWMRESGPRALPSLLSKLEVVRGDDAVDQSMREISGADLKTWGGRWKQHLDGAGLSLPDDLAPGGHPPNMREAARNARLAELLDARGHAKEALGYHRAAEAALPKEGSLKGRAAGALVGAGLRADAAKLVESSKGLYTTSGRWWSLHAVLVAGTDAARDEARLRAISMDPLSPSVACDERAAPEVPSDPERAALCAAARAALRPKEP